jgi:hypothetical protein
MSTLLREQLDLMRKSHDARLIEMQRLTAERDAARASISAAASAACRMSAALVEICTLKQPHPKVRDTHKAVSLAEAALSTVAPCPHEAEVKRLREALRPFASFGQYIRDHPRGGLDNDLYGWDSEPSAQIRKTDLISAWAILAAAEGRGE